MEPSTCHRLKNNLLRFLTRRAALAAAPAVAAVAIGGGTVAAIGADAALLALAPEFEALYAEWQRIKRLEAKEQEDYETRLIEATGFTRESAPKANENDPAWVAYDQIARKLAGEPGQWDGDDWERLTETLYPLVDEILSYVAATVAGLRLHVKALMCAHGILAIGRTAAIRPLPPSCSRSALLPVCSSRRSESRSKESPHLSYGGFRPRTQLHWDISADRGTHTVRRTGLPIKVRP
jgi:hypothetical protein